MQDHRDAALVIGGAQTAELVAVSLVRLPIQDAGLAARGQVTLRMIFFVPLPLGVPITVPPPGRPAARGPAPHQPRGWCWACSRFSRSRATWV